MIYKTDIEKIKMAVELRRRGYSVDIETQENKPFFEGGQAAMGELLRKLQNMNYIHNYIEMKANKYMSDTEKEEWGFA